MFNILKDYLVSLSAEVDTKSFKDIDKAISGTEKKIGKFADTAVGKFATASSAIIGFYSAITAVSLKFANGIAQADREIEKLSKRLYTTEKNARSLSMTMKTMGINSLEELQDVALNPEMRSQFMELRSLSSALDDNSYKEALKYIREINFEFQKFAVRFEYFKMSVVANFAQALKPTIDALKKDIKPFTDNLIKNVPKYSKAIGGFFARLIQIGIHVTQAFAGVIKFITNLPQTIKAIGVSAMGLAFILKSRFGAILLTLQTLFLIIDDFMVYQKGGLSEYSDFWDFVTGKSNLNLANDNFLGLSVFGELIAMVKEIGYYVKQLASKFGIKSLAKSLLGIPASMVTHSFQAEANLGNAVSDKISKTLGLQNWYTGKGDLRSYSGDIGKMRFLTKTYLSSPLQEFITGLSNSLEDATEFSKGGIFITSGTEKRNSGLHPKGEAFDVAFGAGRSISKNFTKTMAYLRDLYALEGFKRAIIETDDAEFINRVRSQLGKEGLDASKVIGMSLRDAGATGENIHTEINPNTQNIGKPVTMNVTNNFYGYDTEKINQALAGQAYNTINEGVAIP